MHPILSQIRRLVAYLVAWIPLAALLAYLMDRTAGMTRGEALAMAFPLCFVYAFVCLSAWYSCRGTPLERTAAGRLVLTHVTSAAVASGLWLLLAASWVHALAATGYFPELKSRMSRAIPLLFGTGGLFYLLSGSFYYVWIAVEASRDAERRAMAAGLLARDAELRALKAQVNPHFLFNSLNSISALTSSDAARAREMCVLLGDFLRRTLGLGEKAGIPLEEELSLIRSFLAVEKVRFGARLKMEEDIGKETLDVMVPPLLLQPLVENAVAHGIANLVEGGLIRLDAHCEDGRLRIVVENQFDPEAPPKRKSGVGLVNVRQRLLARYGSAASFEAATEGNRYRVAVSLPAEWEARAG